MKRHFFKFLLSLVKGLVILKRLFVWLIQSIGRFFVWLLRPVVLYVGVPFYQIIRRYVRRYEDLSPDPWERRRRVLSSAPAVFIILGLGVFSITHAAITASTQPGAISGSRSILFTRLINNGASDWHVEDNGGTRQDETILAEELPTVTYRNGGAVAYVFPYTGNVGKAPIVSDTEPVAPDKTKPTQPTQRYAVVRGDTVSRIAKNFKLKIETILWANNITATTKLRPGDTLTIPATDGVVYTVKNGGSPTDIAKIFNVSAKKIAAANNISATARFKKGQVIIVPDAHPLAAAPTIKPPQKLAEKTQPAPQENTQPVSAGESDTDQIPAEPSIAPIIKQPSPGAGTGMVWPTQRHGITQYFSSYHPGLDIQGDYTDQVFAADDGIVIFSGWNNGGYGNMVLIDHGNGIQTRYAHNSRVFVHVGQQVSKGDNISMVGTTGRSTGTHLHFEIIVAGRRVNPFKYVR